MYISIKQFSIVLSLCFAVLTLFSIPTYSQSKGRAFLVGINKYKNFPQSPTPGAEEDINDTEKLLIHRYGFKQNEIKKLQGSEATSSAIIAQFRAWLIEETSPGDRVFFQYSGHGTRVKDNNGDEADGYDEAIVPHDSDKFGNNLIRDDEFNGLVSGLAGRIVVMVFDSCHSGTMTRDITNQYPRYLPLYVQDIPESGQRDLNLVVDAPRMNNPGLVIISAAHSGQRAYTLEISRGQFRGALTYAFIKSQLKDKPKLRDLKSRINYHIVELQNSGRIPKEQQPLIEVFSDSNKVSLEDHPLYGAVQTTQIFSDGNSKSKLKLKLSVSPDRQSFRIGESFNYEIETSEAGYLYLLVFSEQNIATCLLPNPNISQNNQVAPGKYRTQTYYASHPTGKDVIVALLTKSPLNLGEKEQYSWDEIFSRLRDKNLFDYIKNQTKLRGQTASPVKPIEWQATTLILETN